MHQKIRSWIEQARWAPSADNYQPWQVTYDVQEQEILFRLALTPKTIQTPSEIDANWTTSYVALGAFAKNLQLLAEKDGYFLIDIFDAITSQDSAEFLIHFEWRRTDMASQSAGLIKRTLPTWIPLRTTNRHPYQKSELKPIDLETIAKLQTRLKSCQIQYLPRSTAQHFIHDLTDLDKLRYTRRRLFYSFIETLRFGAAAAQSRDGLAEDTLAVPLLFRWSLKLLQTFKFLWFFNLFGSQNFSAWYGCRRLFQSSAGALIIQGQDDSPRGWFRLGMDMQEIWLSLTAMNLSLQPFGPPLLLYRAHIEESSPTFNLKPLFSKKLRAHLRQMSKRWQTELNIDSKRPLIVFRIGYSSIKAAASFRKNLAAAFETLPASLWKRAPEKRIDLNLKGVSADKVFTTTNVSTYGLGILSSDDFSESGATTLKVFLTPKDEVTLHVNTAWTRKDGHGPTKAGFKISDPPETWIQFIDQQKKENGLEK